MRLVGVRHIRFGSPPQSASAAVSVIDGYARLYWLLNGP